MFPDKDLMTYTISELPRSFETGRCKMPKTGKGCIYEDALVRAKYAGHRPDPDRKGSDHDKFVAEAMA